MKNGTCPKCGSNNLIPNIKFQGHEVNLWVDITEPEPPNRPFIWSPKSVRSTFSLIVCGDCGYAELYADNYKELGEGHKKGFK